MVMHEIQRLNYQSMALYSLFRCTLRTSDGLLLASDTLCH